MLKTGFAFLICCCFAFNCKGSGNLDIDASAVLTPPVDSSADVPRPQTEFLFSELTDIAEDIPRSSDSMRV